MALQYSPDTVPLKPARLGNPEFRAIGRIIHACAEIEDIVTLFIAKLLDKTEAHVRVLLGQTPISKKMSIAGYLAQMLNVDDARRYDDCFGAGFGQVLTCRNALAHGVLLGRSANGHWAFLIERAEEAVPGHAVRQVVSYRTGDLQEYAKAAEMAVVGFENHLGVTKLRSARHGRPLSPHSKAQKKGKRGAQS